MKEFNYVIKDEIGIHARPAGMLVKEIKKIDSKITIKCNGKTADASKLFNIMGLGVKCGDTVTVTIEGGDEEKSLNVVGSFFKENL
ncbi:MAG TPA: HPr family phosphocarrier protein [Clostridiales bacterium]|nr:HPr family phosphocarrier protein [Clostridiales bacterium]